MNPLDYVKKEPYKLYINGQWVASESGELMDLMNPVNLEIYGHAYKGGAADVEKAIKAARYAFDKGPWGKTTAIERSDMLLKLRDVMSKRLKEIAILEGLDCGMTWDNAYDFMAIRALDSIAYFAGRARTIEGKVVPVGAAGQTVFNYVSYHPLGVVAEILPWNCPLLMGAFKIAAILAAGNTVIVKPSSWAPLSLIVFMEMFDEAGFPPGVVNCVTGPGEIVGNCLTDNPDVDMVAMTGSTATGREVIKHSAAHIKDIALELGGKSPNIVFEDCDFDSAVAWSRMAFCLSAGQGCVCGTRLIVQRSIQEKFLAALKASCETMVPGDGFDPNVTMGPLIHPDHAAKVWKYIESGKAQGARLVTGGYSYDIPGLPKGHFCPPTIFADVTPDMDIFQEEIFGPVLCVTPFDTEQEAIDIANSTIYGLAGGVQTRDVARALRVVNGIRSGQIYVNRWYSPALAESPGTGWKESGLGVAGIWKYMTTKTVFIEMGDTSIPPQ